MKPGLTLGRAAPGAGTAQRYPFAFVNQWQPEFNVSGSGVGGYRTDYNPLNDKPVGTTLWVDNINGNDTTGDGSEATPYKTIAKAVTENADVVNIKTGNYWRTDAWAAEFEPAKDMAFVAVDGPGTVKIGRAQDGLSWSSEGSGAYSTTRSNVRFVLDLNEAGHASRTLIDGITPVPLPMEEVADLAAVQAHAGHAWAQSGSTLYIKTHDARAPDTDLLPFVQERNTRLVDADVTLYLDGIEIWGDRPIYHHFPTDLDNNAAIIALNCGFRYSGENDNVYCDAIKKARFIRCAASHNLAGDDGFNYTRGQTANTPQMTFLEVDCEGFENGDNTNDNGSTSHNAGVFGIRVNGDYCDNPGPGIADTQGAQTLNYGVTADNNYIGIQSGTFDTTIPALSYIKDCAASGNSNIDVDRSTGGQLISLGGNTYSTSNDTIIDGTDDFWLTIATIAPDAIVGIFSVDEEQYWDNAGSLINQLNDASPKKYNLLTPAGDFAVDASHAGANDQPVIDCGTEKHSKYFAGSSAMDLKEVIMFGQYGDGTDTTFEDYEAIICGSDSGGAPRTIGSIGLATLHQSNLFAGTVSKNGEPASTTMLPAPMGVYRFTAASVQNSTWDLFGTDAYTNRGWIGCVALAILSNRDLTSDEFTAIKAVCERKYL